MSVEAETPEETPVVEEVEKSVAKRLSVSDYEDIRNRLELGTATVSVLAKEYEVTPGAISNYIRRNGITIGSRKHEIAEAIRKATVAAASSGAARSFESQRKERIEVAKERHFVLNQVIEGKIAKILSETSKPGGAPIGNYNPDLKALRVAATALKTIREEKYVLLDADAEIDENSLTRLPIEVLTEDEIKTMRDAEETDSDDLAAIVEEENEVVEITEED